MEEIKTAVIEDDVHYQSVLQELLKKLSVKCILAFFDSAESFDKTSDFYDLVILDVDLPGMDGIRLSKKIYRRTDNIVFLTSFSDRMQEAFGIHVVGYLLKTSSEDSIIISLNKICSRLNAPKIDLCTKDGLITFNINLICMISAESRSLYVYTEDQKIRLINETLSNIEKKLSPHFITANRSCLINPNHVTSITSDNKVILDNGCSEYLSRGHKNEFKTSLMNRMVNL